MSTVEVASSFDLVEFIIFFAMIGVSALIGVYFWLREKQDTIVDYMLGGKKMSVIPVGLSIIASHISAITLLGVPSEVYLYGTQMILVIVPSFIVASCIILFFLPVLHPLQLTSIFEYLSLRFNSRVQTIGSFIYIIMLLSYIPVVMYTTALGFQYVSGMSVHMISFILSVVCIFYTSLGGIKAVVWSDTFQSFFMLASIVIVLFCGLDQVGGIGRTFEICGKGERLELFNMNPSPFERNTFWTVLIGFTFQWMALIACNPAAMQRYTALPTIKGANMATILFAMGMVVIYGLVGMNGLVIFAKYYDCDPILTKQIMKPGQLLPYYIRDVAHGIPGLAGLFMAGIVSAALSTMSTCLNTVSGTIYEDFIKPRTAGRYTEAEASRIIKFTVLILGVVCLALIFVVERLGTVMQLVLSLSGMTTGAMVFLFTYGMFCPWGTSKGAIGGALASLIFMASIVLGAQISMAWGHLSFPAKFTSVAGCPSNLTQTMSFNVTEFGYHGVGSPVVASEGVPLLFRLSYLHYHSLGALVAFVAGTVVTLATGKGDPSFVDPKHIVPQLRRFLPEKPEVLLMKKIQNPS